MADNNNKITFAFNLSDLPMMADAMSIAGCTAMLCGQPAAQKRCDEIKEMIEAHIPPILNLIDGEEWINIVLLLGKSTKWNVYEGGSSWSRHTRYYKIIIDDKVWQSKGWIDDKVSKTERAANIAGLVEALDSMAPLTTERDGTLIGDEL